MVNTERGITDGEEEETGLFGRLDPEFRKDALELGEFDIGVLSSVKLMIGGGGDDITAIVEGDGEEDVDTD